MPPKYQFKKEGTGKATNLIVLDAETGEEVYRFASIDPDKDKPEKSTGCANYLGWGCLLGFLGLIAGLEFDFGGGTSGGYTPVPGKWDLRRVDGYVVYQLKDIRRGFDVLRDEVSIGRIEWKKRRKILNHQLILGDRLVATEVPTKLFRDEIHIEMETGRLATLKNTDSTTSPHYGEVFMKRELPEEELGLVLGVGLLWLG